MRTTFDLNDALLTAAKHIAAEQHTSLKAVVEDGLRMLVSMRQRDQQPAPHDAWPICARAQPVPGVNLTRTSTLMDLTEAP